MKKIIIFLLFMPQLFYGQWVQQVSGTNENLNDIFCVTEDLVFAVGDNGTILKTTDGGATWVQKTSGTTQNLKKVKFANANVGYALDENGILFKSANGGENWNIIIGTNFNDFSLVNENLIYASNYINGNLYKTSNGGITFQIINSLQNIISIKFVNDQIGFLSTSGNLLKTNNGGLTWSTIYNNFYRFDFLNENIGFITCLDGLYKTINGGLSFNLIDSNINGINKLYVSNENIIWGTPILCPLNGSPCYSMRGEINNLGIYLRENDNNIYSSFSFTNNIVGYSVSKIGKIYKNITGALNVKSILKNKFIKIYPIPTIDKLNISFDEKISKICLIEIKDNLGKIIFSKFYFIENEISIDTQNFSKGVYFLTFTSGESKQTEKLIIN